MSPSSILRVSRCLMLASLLAAAGCQAGEDSNESKADTDPGIGDGNVNPTPGTPGVVVTPQSGLRTSESGGTATFTIALSAKPSADVTINLSSSNEKEGTIDKKSVAFTSANWDAPQTITVTGVDDTAPDGPQTYTIVTAPAVSDDPAYTNIDGADVAVTNTDDDSAGITVTPTTGLKTSEMGDSATFTVKLNTKPSADVVIALSSSNDKEGVASPKSLTFTTENWNAPQTVTVTGVDDSAADGPQTYKIVTAPATSADKAYDGQDADDVTVINSDDETPGITVSPTTGLVTTEGGGTATFTVRLNTKPSGNVTIPLSSSKTTEGTVSPASLTFTADNWNAPQTVTVTGVDDSAADGNQVYKVITGAATSSDTGYAGVDAEDVEVSNTDDESAGVTITPVDGLVTTESGGTATFTVRLNSKPTATVTIGLTSSNDKEGTVSPASVTFTPDNWNAPQTVTVTGVDDPTADGNQPYKIVTAPAVSDDKLYSGLNPADVNVSNTDNDSAGVTVTPTSGLVTTEAGGTATFTIRLNSQPSADVTIPLTSSKTTEGTVSPASVKFTTTNWNAPQTVTVTGVDDKTADGNQLYVVRTGAATSTDARYAGIDASDVTVSNTDDDSAGITVSIPGAMTVTESGGTAFFTIKLNSQPTGDVTIPLTSSDTTEGTVSPSSVTFTTLNWNAPQAVTVTGVDDSVADGAQPFNIITGAAVSTDTGYSGINAVDVAVSNTDDDSAGFTVTPTTGLTTTEAGGTATFTVRLNSQPTASVTIPVSSSKTAEGTVSTASLTFTTANWNSPQTVTITGVDDKVADGAQPYTIVLGVATSSDSGYAGLNPPDVSVSNTDNDSAGITLSTTGPITTTEAGGTATFTIRLNSQPTADVTIPLSSSKTSEGTVSPSSVTFTALNWNAPQTVTVTGVDDKIADGAQPYSIVTGAATSADTGYSGMNASDVSVSNTDNDSAGFTISTISGNTTEAKGTATFTVKLNSQPTGTVVIPVSSSDTSEGTVSTSSLTFDATNWGTAQTVTVTGVDDAIADGVQNYNIVLGTVTGTDGSGYVGMNPADVAVSNTDDDTAGVTVTPTSGLVTTEALGTATFTVKLNSQPLVNVVIPLSSSNTAEGTVSPASLTFTPSNWMTAQTVTVTGVNDFIADGNQTYTIRTGLAQAVGDTGYNNFDAADVSVTNDDNDSPGVTVSPTSGLRTTEAGGTATFTIVLTSQPTADVTINLASNDTTEGTVSPASVTFTSSNWSTARTITVTGVDDASVDGDVLYTIVTTMSTTDAKYSPINPSDVTVTNADNDTAIDCTKTVCGASCAEIAKKYGLPDGSYLMIAPGTKEFTVYCHNMKLAPTEYLTVSGKNVSIFESSGSACVSCGDFQLNYTRVRLFLSPLSIDRSDQTFATDANGNEDCYIKNKCTSYRMNWGSGGSCNDLGGLAITDLNGTPFVFDDKVGFIGAGLKPFVKLASMSADRKVTDISNGGGFCGSWGFNSSSVGLMYKP